MNLFHPDCLANFSADLNLGLNIVFSDRPPSTPLCQIPSFFAFSFIMLMPIIVHIMILLSTCLMPVSLLEHELPEGKNGACHVPCSTWHPASTQHQLGT